MKHCHFSILYNELPFLKRKLPFLYKHFHQIIFYDLNVKTLEFSDDGSHEFIKNFPDPDKKISLIEQKDLTYVMNFNGRSFIRKQQMYAIGSLYVKSNMDVFWCTDLDEFFEESLIKKVEDTFKNTNSNTILVPHEVYYFNDSYSIRKDLDYARIMKHEPNRIYGHCEFGKEPICTLDDEILYHFAYIGKKRVQFKSELYEISEWYKNEWLYMNDETLKDLGYSVNKYKIPEYIEAKEIVKELTS